MKTPIGSFERDGESRDAYTAGEATSLRNAGWRLVGEQGPEPQTSPDGAVVLSAEGTAAVVAEAPKPETKRSHRKRKDNQ